MARMMAGLVAVVTMALMVGPSLVRAQTKPAPYHPLTNGQMSELGIWDQWVTTFNEMTPKQRAGAG